MGQIKKKSLHIYTTLASLPPWSSDTITNNQDTFKVAGWRNGEVCLSCSFLESGSNSHSCLFVQGRQFLCLIPKLSCQCEGSSFIPSLSLTSPPGPCLFHTCLSPPWNSICLDVLSFIFSTRFTEDVNKQENVEGVNKRMKYLVSEKPSHSPRFNFLPCVYTGTMWPNRLWTSVFPLPATTKTYILVLV